MFSGGLGLDPSLFSISPMRLGLRRHPFKVLQGPSRVLSEYESFIFGAGFPPLFRMVCFQKSCAFQIPLPPNLHPECTVIHNRINGINVFLTLLPYLYGVIDALNGPLYHQSLLL